MRALRPGLFTLVWVIGLAGIAALGGCSRAVGGAMEAGPTAAPTVPSTPGQSAPGPPAPGVSARGPSAPSTTTVSAEQRFLTAARRTYPQRDDASLVTTGRDICRRLGTHSTHDEVGALAGQLGSQARAMELVDAAAAAYCPASMSTTGTAKP